MKKTHLRLPKIIAHRGAPRVAPENTLASLRAAKELGAEWVEFDVCLTQDQKAIIFHDEKLNRTTNGKGLVSETPFSKIATLDAGSWFDAKFAGEHVPTFTQYVQTAASLDLGMNVELKGKKATSHVLAERVIEVLKTDWPTRLPAPLISSGSLDCLHAVRRISDSYALGVIMDEWQPDWLSILQSVGAASVHVNHKQLTAERIKFVKKESYLLLAYTINEANLARRLFSQGVDAVFSDEPRLFS